MKQTAYILGLLFIMVSCKKFETFSDVPEIRFEEFTLEQTVDGVGNPVKLGTLRFSFTDGDGDVGLFSPESYVEYINYEYMLNYTIDSLPEEFKYNLFFTFYQKINSEFVEDTNLKAALKYRIPFMETSGNNKTLKGDVDIELYYYNPKYDTIKYSFYILDRELNQSNTETTPELSLTLEEDIF